MRKKGTKILIDEILEIRHLYALNAKQQKTLDDVVEKIKEAEELKKNVINLIKKLDETKIEFENMI